MDWILSLVMILFSVIFIEATVKKSLEEFGIGNGASMSSVLILILFFLVIDLLIFFKYYEEEVKE